MNRSKDLEKLLEETMSAEATDVQVPHPTFFYEAREKVAARKKLATAQAGFLDQLAAFFRFHLKFYHVGLCLLLISGGVLYVSEPSYTSVGSSGFIPSGDALSIQNTTISVNSSTMLTSIPTLVIRN